jgi:hypothetical protein
MTEPTVTAEDLARELLARLPDRFAHTEEVARKAEEVAAVFEPDEAADLVAAAWLHDIGYAPWLVGIKLQTYSRSLPGAAAALGGHSDCPPGR